MPRTRSWSSLLPGIAALTAVIVGGGAVLKFGHVGGLRGRTVRLYAAVPEARGLVSGSEVWLLGEKIGVVNDISFRPPTTDTLRLIVALDVVAADVGYIRRDATVDIVPGGNLVGAPVVSITPGTASARAAQASDTIVGGVADEVDRARSSLDAATSALPIILGNLRLLTTQIKGAGSTLGAFGIEGGRQVAAVSASASRTMSNVRSGNGTVGLALAGGPLVARARSAVASADSVRSLFSDPSARGPIGRFRRDTTLPRTVADIRAELSTVSRQLEESRGTAGRLQHDSALVNQLALSRAALATLADDIKHHPLRYIVF